MAVKKGILETFLKPSSHYSDNQKNFRSIFIDKNEDDLKPDPQNFLETTVLHGTSEAQQENQMTPSSLENPSEKEENNPIERELEHKWNTNGTQIDKTTNSQLIDNNNIMNTSGTQMEHIRNTNGTHQEHKWNTRGRIGTQMEHKWNTNGTQMEHAKEHKQEHNRNTNGTQMEHKWNTNYTLSYLTGIQKKLLTLLFLSCKKTRSRTTEEFSLSNIANTLKIRLGSVKTSLRRLEEKQFIKATQYKKGRGGWTKFDIPDNVYRELLENDKEHNWNTNGTQMEHKWNTQRNTQRNTNASSSSSNNIKTTTTTSEPLKEEWNFDVTPFASFGFTPTHIKQLASLEIISAVEVEQSLIEFSYDLNNNTLPLIKTSKINFLMGLFRSGHSYISESFKNEQDAMISEMARRAEDKRKKLIEEQFVLWEANLDEVKRREILSKMPTQLMVLEKAYGTSHREVKEWYFEFYLNIFENTSKK